jgi:hypothetical protein
VQAIGDRLHGKTRFNDALVSDMDRLPVPRLRVFVFPKARIGFPIFHHIHHILDAFDTLNDRLRHLFEVVGRRDAVDDDHHGIRYLALEPSLGRIAARLKLLQCSVMKAIIYRPKTVLLNTVGN